MASRSQLRSNPFGKFASAARQPFKKVFSKPHAGEGSIKSTTTTTTTTTGTETTQAVEQLVRFSEKKRVRKTLSRKDYTLDETKATWWSVEESGQIARQYTKEIKKIERGEKFKDKKFCARGLEGHTQIGSASKRQRRALAIDAVLDEQMIQWADGVFDEQTIADVYDVVSSRCQLWASLVGRRDHRAAEEIYESSHKEQAQSSAAPHYNDDHQQTTNFGNEGLKQSLVLPRAA
jgi:hypothetical protein